MDYRLLIDKYNKGIRLSLFLLYAIVLPSFFIDLYTYGTKYPLHLLLIQIFCTFSIIVSLCWYIIRRKNEIFHFTLVIYLNVLPILATHLFGQEYLKSISLSPSEMISRDYFILICFISVSGFISNRINIFILSAFQVLLVFYYIFILKNEFIINNAPSYIIIILGFSIFMYFLSSYIHNFNNSLKTANYELTELKTTAESKNLKLEFYNQLQIEIARNFSNLQNRTDLINIYRIVCETAGNKIAADSVGIWMFDFNNRLLTRKFLWSKNNEPEKIDRIPEKDYPVYFNALYNRFFILSPDVASGDETKELLKNNERTENLVSLLDCSILLDGMTIGAICCKKYHEKSSWGQEEVLFIESLANTVAMNIKNLELKTANQELENALTMLNEAQDHLIRADKMASLGLIAAGVAHDINNPLNYIMGGYTRLDMEFKDNPGQMNENINISLQAIKTGIDRVTEIVQSLGFYSRTGENQEEICNIHEILDHCLIILNNQLKYRIKVTKTYTGTGHVLKGNNGKLHQVFTNIISNAIHAIPDKGSISISTSMENNLLLVSIKDTGTGISKENLAKIMKPFFTTKEPGKGTGLGLSIVQSIIHEHNGSIEFFSEEGKGTEALVKLPVSFES
ncbi:MAG: ATP-binding protein [Bacteroidales bacterium]